VGSQRCGAMRLLPKWANHSSATALLLKTIASPAMQISMQPWRAISAAAELMHASVQPSTMLPKTCRPKRRSTSHAYTQPFFADCPKVCVRWRLTR
jgi:hypothetical protein